MSRRIRVNPAVIRRSANEFSGQLRRIANWVKSGRITRDQAKEISKKTFEDELKRLIAITHRELSTRLRGLNPSLPPEELDRLKKWRDEEYANFCRVIDAI